MGLTPIWEMRQICIVSRLVSEDFRPVFRQFPRIEVFFDEASGVLPSSVPIMFRVNEDVYGFRDVLWRGYVDDPTGFFIDRFLDASRLCGDDRDSCRHRLENGVGDAVLVAVRRDDCRCAEAS